MIHARILDATGGLHVVRDINLIASIIEKPKSIFGGKEFYPSLFEKAAVYFDSCARYQAFFDGNKRTALAIAARFLYLNGYELLVSNSEFEKFVITAVIKKYDIQRIAVWLKKHSKKIAKK